MDLVQVVLIGKGDLTEPTTYTSKHDVIYRSNCLGIISRHAMEYLATRVSSLAKEIGVW